MCQLMPRKGKSYTVCCSLQGTVNLIAAAKAAGVKKFVLVTSIGTDDPLFPLNLFWGVSHSVQSMSCLPNYNRCDPCQGTHNSCLQCCIHSACQPICLCAYWRWGDGSMASGVTGSSAHNPCASSLQL